MLSLPILVILLFFSFHAHAVDWSGPNEAELKSLPPYCQAKYNPNSPDKKQWEQSLGLTFQRISHYCSALNFMNRYHKSSKKDKASLLSLAIGEFGYMVEHSEQNSPLLPEILISRAMALKYANKDSDSIKDYYSAIELNPKVARAYAEFARLYAGKTMTEKALEVATQGLRHLPDDVVLQGLYKKYGGKPPYPEPLIKEEKKSLEKPMPSSSIAEESRPLVDVKRENTSEASIPPINSTTNPRSSNTGSGEAVEKKEKTQKNPWCRFCPE